MAKKIKLPKRQEGGIVDPRGQWAHPGKITIIPGTDITMQGVNYPVLGISDTGHTQMMEPGKDYKFNGTKVTEYPQQSIGKSQTASGGLQFGGNVTTAIMKKKIKMAQTGTGLSGPVLRSGPNVKNSAPPNPVVTKAPDTGNFVNNTFPMQLGGYNWQVPAYQEGGMPTPQQGQVQQTPPSGPTGAPSQDQGDPQQQQVMQLMHEVEEALQQGVSPKEVIKTLVKQGVPKKAAEQILQQVVSQSAQQPQQQAPQQGQDPNQQPPQGDDQAMPQAKIGIRMMAMGDGVVDPTTSPNWVMVNTGPQAPPTQYPYGSGGTESAGDTPYQAPMQVPPITTNNPPSTDNIPAPGGAPTQTRMSVRQPWYTGDMYVDRSIYTGQRAQELKGQYQQDQLNPNADPQQLHRERQAITGNEMVSGVSGVQAGINGIETGLGLAGKIFSNSQARKQEMEQQFYNNNKNRQVIRPDRGSNSAPALAQNGYVIPYGNPSFGAGGRLPLFQMGGMPTEGSDFQSGNPNVMTEKGETLTDPNQGPMGPGGQPTGAVVHDTTGDAHSDPSGGNAYNLGPNSVVHSKVLGLTVGDFLAAIKGQSHASYIAAKVTEKYPNPDKEVSYAQLAKLFETKKLIAEVEKIAKKAEDMEKKDPGNDATSVTRKTRELNKKTLARQDANKKEQMATNTDIAGADGPIHNISENLKMQGAYGDKVQKDTMATAQGNAPTAGAGIKMKGKKMLLPEAQLGRRVDYQAQYDNAKPGITGEQPYIQPPTPGGPESYYNSAPPVLGTQQLLSTKPAESFYDPNSAVATGTPVSPPTGGQMPLLHSNPVTTPSGVTQDASHYSQTANPYFPAGGTGLNRDNLRSIFGQYSQKDKETNGYYNEVSSQLDKGERTLNPVVANWNVYGQPKNADGTFGNISDQDVMTLENAPGFEFMKKIAKDNGTLHFDPKSQEQIDAYEKTVNATDKENGAIQHFTENNTQPFGYKKFGNWHASYNPWVYKSEGAGQPQSNDPNKPVIYQNTPLNGPKDDTKAPVIPPFQGGPNNPNGKRIYQEGLNPMNIAEPLAALFMKRDPAPYIEDQGAKNALAATTKQQFYNTAADKADIDRSFRALTQYNPQNNPSVVGQAASNAYAAKNQVAEKASNLNAQIQKGYEDTANTLRERAGTNKAQALDKLAQRTATVKWKDSALTLNSIGDIGKAYMENKLENRKAAINQGIFKNAGWDPITGTYIGNTSANLTAGSPDLVTQLRSEGMDELAIQRIMHGIYYNDAGQERLARGAEENREHRGLNGKQLGGKVKRIKMKNK